MRDSYFKFALVAAIVAFPLIVLLAFYSSTRIIATNAPLFNFINLGSPRGNISLPTANLTQIAVTNSSTPANELQFPNIFPNISVPGSYLIAAMVVVLLLVGLGLILSFRRKNAVTAFEDSGNFETQRIEVAKILDRAISELMRGSEYRKTVLECYRTISELLEVKSSIDGTPLTAREFEQTVSKTLKLDTPYLSQVTGIFEKARYSRLEISKDDAELAIQSLSNLSDLLKNVSTG